MAFFGFIKKIFGLTFGKVSERGYITDREISILEQAGKDADKIREFQIRENEIIDNLIGKFKELLKCFPRNAKVYILNETNKIIVKLKTLKNDESAEIEQRNLNGIKNYWKDMRNDLSMMVGRLDGKKKTKAIRTVSDIDSLFGNLTNEIGMEIELSVQEVDEVKAAGELIRV